MAGRATPPHFHLDDADLDDADLWAVIDSATTNPTAFRSRKPLLALKDSPAPIAKSPASHSSPSLPPKYRRMDDGEVVQEETMRLGFCRPQKIGRYGDCSASGEDKRVVVVRHSPQQLSPKVTFPGSPEVEPSVERTSPHSLSGAFPPVGLFKQYQNAAMAILEKTDYTMISGNPFIKKSGWRKIAFYFNLSFEIKDRTVEYDDNRNVLRAEFVVRAYMQGGRFSDGWGSCERREKRFIRPNHDIPSTAETRAKNKACQDLLGVGQYHAC